MDGMDCIDGIDGWPVTFGIATTVPGEDSWARAGDGDSDETAAGAAATGPDRGAATGCREGPASVRCTEGGTAAGWSGGWNRAIGPAGVGGTSECSIVVEGSVSGGVPTEVAMSAEPTVGATPVTTEGIGIGASVVVGSRGGGGVGTGPGSDAEGGDSAITEAALAAVPESNRCTGAIGSGTAGTARCGSTRASTADGAGAVSAAGGDAELTGPLATVAVPGSSAARCTSGFAGPTAALARDTTGRTTGSSRPGGGAWVSDRATDAAGATLPVGAGGGSGSATERWTCISPGADASVEVASGERSSPVSTTLPA
jgi:hypothetical protein